jgi:hypothetical protein
MDTTAKIEDTGNGEILVKIEDPPVEGRGRDLAEALRDAAYETERFAEGVWDALEQTVQQEFGDE